MVAPLTISSSRGGPTFLLPKPDRLPTGAEPELRVCISGLSWESVLAYDQSLGQDRSTPRLYYAAGELEIMTPSHDHEQLKTSLRALLEIYLEEAKIPFFGHGHATLIDRQKGIMAEPDESWCLHQDKACPDLALEIALTSGGIQKLPLYATFRVKEVWLWKKGKLEIHILKARGYVPAEKSLLLPGLDVKQLSGFLTQPSWKAREAYRTALRTMGRAVPSKAKKSGRRSS